MSRLRLLPSLLLAAALALPVSAGAGTGAEWLARTDAAATRIQDAHVVLEVTLEAEGEAARRTLEIWQEGPDRRLVRITDPPRLAGVGLLRTDDTLHLYLPAYGRARRVVGRSRGDAFLGTDIPMEDLARTTFGDEYTAEVEEEGAEETRLRLTPRDPAAHAHAASRLWVRRADDLWTRVEHLDPEGRVVRRVVLSDFRTVDGHPFAFLMEVEDLDRHRRTRVRVTEAALDRGLDDDLFTVTRLSRP